MMTQFCGNSLLNPTPNLAKVMEIATECMQTAESLHVISNKSKVTVTTVVSGDT